MQAVGLDRRHREHPGEKARRLYQIAQLGQVHAGGQVGGDRREHVTPIEGGARGLKVPGGVGQ